MSEFEKAVKASGGKILGMKVVEEHDPMAEFLNMDGRIEEWTVQREDGKVETVRVANLQKKGTFYAK